MGGLELMDWILVLLIIIVILNLVILFSMFFSAKTQDLRFDHYVTNIGYNIRTVDKIAIRLEYIEKLIEKDKENE